MTYCRGTGGDLADDRRQLVREDRGEPRHVAGATVLDGEDIPDGLLAFGDAVEVAHGGDYDAPRLEDKHQSRDVLPYCISS